MGMRLKDVRQGDRLIADGGFACLDKGQQCEVLADRLGLFINCRKGKHYLDGQTSGMGVLIGLDRAPGE